LKIGIATSLYVNYPIHEAVRQIASLGFECVDIWGGRPHVYRQDYSAAELKALRAEIESRGMTVSSFMPAFYRYPHNLCSPNPRVWKDSLEYVVQSLDNAAELGAPLFLVCPARLLVGQDVADAWDRLANSLRLICDRAAPLGMKIVLEPVNKGVFDLINNTADAMRIIGVVGAGNLGVILDSGHLYLSDESIQQALATVGERLFQVHVSDNDGKRQQNLVPGDGTFDFKSFFSELRRHCYAGVVSVELSGDYAADPQPAAAESLRRIKQWLKR